MKRDPLVRVLNASLAARRGLALALLVLVMGCGLAVIGSIFSSLAQEHQAITEKRQLTGKLEAFAKLRNTLSADMKPSSGSGDAGEFLLGNTEALARATLQTQLSDLISARGATLSSASNLPAIDDAGARYVGIRADISGTVDAVHSAVLAIEAASPPLIIREAALWRNENDGGASAAPQIAAQLHVYGAAQPGTLESKAP